MFRRFVITDIHGCHKTFQTLLEETCQLGRNDELYLLGDYINKGKDSRRVIDYIWNLERDGYRLNCLRGNHEELLLDLLHDASVKNDFLDRGGHSTIASFEVDNVHQIPEPYIRWMNSLPYYKVLNDVVLVHGGVDTSLEAPYADTDALLNLRDYTIDPAKTGYRKVLHGHNPKPLPAIQQAIQEDHRWEIPLDAGCVYTHREGMGHLVALELRDWKLYTCPNLEDN